MEIITHTHEPIQIANREYRKVEYHLSDGSYGRDWEWRLLDRPDMPFVQVLSYEIRDQLDRGLVPWHLRAEVGRLFIDREPSPTDDDNPLPFTETELEAIQWLLGL